ncbi:hypothetical protein PGT21_014335 [Puccinia graminis f. sp. tritici]|uniref:Uncharacterized protein n=1 Tax=Puccinia graminis f. sp. tritici TaxID=56615 RepID=A0A5B0PXJ2_PUCGR|nr:hypothetical protein PGTUg99_020134 [Puccinia graminis f. sp. tritici]KAA1105648.1 hypothetical protein PGT21_014335 [Puccinia graminis f. sp. tritici]
MVILKYNSFELTDYEQFFEIMLGAQGIPTIKGDGTICFPIQDETSELNRSLKNSDLNIRAPLFPPVSEGLGLSSRHSLVHEKLESVGPIDDGDEERYSARGRSESHDHDRDLQGHHQLTDGSTIASQKVDAFHNDRRSHAGSTPVLMSLSSPDVPDFPSNFKHSYIPSQTNSLKEVAPLEILLQDNLLSKQDWEQESNVLFKQESEGESKSHILIRGDEWGTFKLDKMIAIIEAYRHVKQYFKAEMSRVFPPNDRVYSWT